MRKSVPEAMTVRSLAGSGPERAVRTKLELEPLPFELNYTGCEPELTRRKTETTRKPAHQSDSQCGSVFYTQIQLSPTKVKNLFCSSKLFMVYYIHHTTYFKGEES